MKSLRSLTFGLAVGSAFLTAYGQAPPTPKDAPKPPGAGVPRTPPKQPSAGSPETPKVPRTGAPDAGTPKLPGAGSPNVAPPKSPRAGSPETPPPKLPRTGPGDVTPPKSPRAGDSDAGTPKLPRTGNPDAGAPKSPRAGSPDVTPPKSPRAGNPDLTPPRPRSNDPDTGAPKSPRAGSPDADTPRSPRDGLPSNRRPLDTPGNSNEARKPDLPGNDKIPGNSSLDAAPKPDRSNRAPRSQGRSDTNRPQDNAADKPDTPNNRRPETPDRPNAPGADRPRDNDRNRDADRPTSPNRPNAPDADRPRGNDRNRDADRPSTERPNTPDRPNDRNRDADRNDRGRDNDRNPNADRSRDGDRNRDADRDDIPSGFTRAMDRNARDAADRPVKQLRIDPRALRNDSAISETMKNLQNVRSADQLERAFSNLEGRGRDGRLAAMNLDRVSGRFQARIRNNDFDPLIRSRYGQRFNLDRQFGLFARGDVARQLSLNVSLVDNGGWRSRYVGPIYSGYTRYAVSAWYPGPQWYPAYTWMPRWSPWVQWSFWNTVVPIYDPRPFVVRPYVYDVAPVVTTYEFPAWEQLPVVSAGTWVDVEKVAVPSGDDLQLLAVRFVDPGHTEEDLGPRYRVWLRNNASQAVNRSIDVTAFASADEELSNDVVQAGVTVPEIAGDDTIAIDIRLPSDANYLVTEDNDVRVPFKYLHVVVDSRNALKEHNEANNGSIVKRGEIFPVDPAAFSTDVTAAAPGSTISIAGEGLGPEPGEVIVTVGEDQHPATVRGWYDLGIQIIVPDLDLREAADAQVLVVRGDGAASNPVPLTIAPETEIGMLPPAPAPER
jgi:hypothetical protein